MFVILLRINLSFMNKLYDIIPGCHLKIESVIKKNKVLTVFLSA